MGEVAEGRVQVVGGMGEMRGMGEGVKGRGREGGVDHVMGVRGRSGGGVGVEGGGGSQVRGMRRWGEVRGVEVDGTTGPRKGIACVDFNEVPLYEEIGGEGTPSTVSTGPDEGGGGGMVRRLSLSEG